MEDEDKNSGKDRNCKLAPTERMEDKIKQCEEISVKLYHIFEENKVYEDIECDIDLLFEYAFDKNKNIWQYCADKLYWLATISTDIQKRILEIMRMGRTNEKFILTCSISTSLNRDFIAEIVRLAILDKSKKVKTFGAQQADRYNLYEFADLIKEESEKVEDRELKERLMLDYIYLTRGYIIEKSDSEYGDWLKFRDGSERLPREIGTEDIHKYVITKYKNKPRIEDLHYRDK